MTTSTDTPYFDTLLREYAEAEVNIQEIRERSPWEAPSFDSEAAWDRVLRKAKEKKPVGNGNMPKQRQKKQRGS